MDKTTNIENTKNNLQKLENIIKEESVLVCKNKIGANFMNQENPKLSFNELEIDIYNIKKVWVLKKVIEFKSLRKASQFLKITPSAVSQNLKSLEQICGRSLIIRNKNGSIDPTKEAYELIEKSKPIFLAFNSANVEMKNKPQIDYINLGFYEAFSSELASDFCDHLKKLYPHLKVKIYSDKNYNLLKHLKQGRLCSALITAESDVLENLYAQPIFQTELGFYAKSNYPCLEDALEEGESLALLMAADEGVPLYMSRFLKQFEVNLKSSFTADSYSLLCSLAKQGSAISLLPKVIGEKEGLYEIHSKQKDLKEKGSHTVYLVSEKHCDKEEADFLTQILKSVCLQKNLATS